MRGKGDSHRRSYLQNAVGAVQQLQRRVYPNVLGEAPPNHPSVRRSDGDERKRAVSTGHGTCQAGKPPQFAEQAAGGHGIKLRLRIGLRHCLRHGGPVQARDSSP